MEALILSTSVVALAHRINMKAMRRVAAALFVVLGFLALFAPAPGT